MAVPNEILVHDFVALTTGFIVYFVGVFITRRYAFLRNYNIPEPVTGGLIAAFGTLAIYLLLDNTITFDLQTRNLLLIYFFTAIGLDARISDLIRGGRQLLILLVLTLVFIVVQNVVGVLGVSLFGLPSAVSVLTGSASLIGGHGTAIAWAPEIGKTHNIPNAMEIGIACATFGLILASLMGGPVAKKLIEKHDLKSDGEGALIVGLPYDEENGATINHMTLSGALLTLHVAIIMGYLLNQQLGNIGIKLPLFVTCLLVAIVISNTIPKIFHTLPWPARTPALALISDYSLNIFLAMSLMSMQLWTLAGLAGPLLGILMLQTVTAYLFIMLLLYRAMGSNYEAAVLSAGFAGFSLGATPVAIANMTAVTKKNGPAPNAFIILPLVAAFFVDIANAIIIQFFVG